MYQTGQKKKKQLNQIKVGRHSFHAVASAFMCVYSRICFGHIKQSGPPLDFFIDWPADIPSSSDKRRKIGADVLTAVKMNANNRRPVMHPAVCCIKDLLNDGAF